MSFGEGPSAPPELFQFPHWYAIRTRARAEKQVARLLDQAGILSYCPVLETEREWADRKKRVAFPLFSGYTFASFLLTEVGEVLRVPGIVTIVRSKGYPTPLRDEELDAVRKLEEGVGITGERPIPEDYLEVGDEVVVTDGPFKGMRGQLLEKRGKTRVAVKLSAIRQAVSVEMSREAVLRVA